jgi:hypothetical protein
MMPSDKPPDLRELIGEQLSAVSFVMDYVEFHFDAFVLRALTDPAIEGPEGRHKFPGPGARDALCQAIGADVAEVHENDDAITVRLTSGHLLTVPLDDTSRGQLPEAANLHTRDLSRGMRVW